MNDPERLKALLDALGLEIVTAQPDSTQGQFPILDLLGNLRDEASSQPALASLAASANEAWERMVLIVESGNPFQPDQIAWLHDLFPHLQSLAESTPTPASSKTPPQPADPAADTSHSTGHREPECPPILLNLADDADLLREFITESREHLDNIEQGVLILENQPDDAETLNTVFRAFHSFKGGAGFLNLVPINRLAHVLESLLDLARQGRLTIDPPVIDLILQGRDVLRHFIDEIDGQIAGNRAASPIVIPTSELKHRVTATIETASQHAPSAVAPSPLDSSAFASLSAAPEAIPVPTSPAAPAAPAPATPTAAAPPPPTTPANPRTPAAPETVPQKNQEVGPMIKVDTIKLDALLDLVGEMVIAQSLVGRDLDHLASLNPQSARNIAQLGRITRELQRVSMSLRMVPIRGLFQKMARVIRDLSAKSGKKVQFVTLGEDTELDRSLVEDLSDPLLHMVRNAMDHGIEPPEVREAAGKPPVGTLTLRAYHQGGNIVVEIQDDGAGLNPERILRKAVERGLTPPNSSLTDPQIFSFIFAAGFSTADKVTDLSGRGVGLDVVRRNLERLRGCIDIASNPGRGARFKLTLPLTLAIIDGLIVRVGDERYVIPNLAIRGIFRQTPGIVSVVHGGAEVVNVRGRLVPLLRLRRHFGLDPAGNEASDGIIIVVQAGTAQRCLMVDATLHIQEVVIKNLNDIMAHKNRALAGAAILGDGRVGLILDVNALVQLESDPLSEAA